MRTPKYPPECPAFRTVATGHDFEGYLNDDNTVGCAEHSPGGHTPNEIIPLTPTALIMYVIAGGTEETLEAALAHKRGRKPTATLYDDAEVYTTRADLHKSGY
jgi:hypothetical protein